MKAKYTPTSINLLYLLSNFSLVMLLIGFFAVIVFNIFVYVGSLDDRISINVPFPMNIDFHDAGNLVLNNQNIKVDLINASAKLKIHNVPAKVLKLAGFMMIFSIMYSFLLIVIFRKFMKNVKTGLVFTVENINLLKYLSYGVVVVWVFQAIIMPIFYLYISSKFEFKDISTQVVLFQYSSTLVIALVIWVLAHIFLHGVRLQQEKDLTI